MAMGLVSVVLIPAIVARTITAAGTGVRPAHACGHDSHGVLGGR